MITASDVATTLGRTAGNMDDLCDAVTEMMRENSEHTAGPRICCACTQLSCFERDAQAYNNFVQRCGRTNLGKVLSSCAAGSIVCNFAQLDTDEGSEHSYVIFTRACREVPTSRGWRAA